jgi:hypothetical protein
MIGMSALPHLVPRAVLSRLFLPHEGRRLGSRTSAQTNVVNVWD